MLATALRRGAALCDDAAAGGHSPRPAIARHLEQVAPAEGPGFTVMQFNILADGLSALRPDLGNFKYATPEALAWPARGPRVLDEVLSQEPDVVCVQELDHFDDDAAPVMAAAGYSALFVPKPESPCRMVSDLDDGAAVFVRDAAFAVLHTAALRLCDAASGAPQNQVAALALLEHRASGRRVLVASTHLRAKKTPEGERVRAAEVRWLLDRLARAAAELGGVPVVLAGDFNAAPHAGKYPALTYEATRAHALGLASAYAVGGEEPEYTTWKVRSSGEKAGEVKHTIDYIWHSADALRTTHLLSIPTGEELGPERMPSERYPSDHLAIMARLEFVGRSGGRASADLPPPPPSHVFRRRSD